MHVVYIVIKLLTKPTHNKNTSYCPIVIDYENDTVLCHCTASRPGFMLYIRANSTLAFDNLDLFSPVNFTWKWKTMKFSAQLCRLPDVTDHLANRPTPVPKFFPKPAPTDKCDQSKFSRNLHTSQRWKGQYRDTNRTWNVTAFRIHHYVKQVRNGVMAWTNNVA